MPVTKDSVCEYEGRTYVRSGSSAAYFYINMRAHENALGCAHESLNLDHWSALQHESAFGSLKCTRIQESAWGDLMWCSVNTTPRSICRTEATPPLVVCSVNLCTITKLALLVQLCSLHNRHQMVIP